MKRKFALHAPRVSYYYGGAERFILNFLEESIRQKKNITLVTYDAPEKSEWFKRFYRKCKNKIILIKSTKLDKLFTKFKKATKPLQWDKESRLFSEEANKVCYSRDFTNISYHYTVDCLYSPKDVMVHLHLHGLPDKKRQIESDAIKKADQIIAVSSYVGKGWKKLHNIRKKINVVHNAINPCIFTAKKKKTKDIIYFGRLIKIKGVDTLIKALRENSKRNKDISVIIIGEGPEKIYLEKLAKKCGIEKNVEFKGRVSDKELKKLILSSRLSVFPSYKREGVITTLLEAMNLGCVVIAANACSNTELIEDGKNGFLFPPKNHKELSKWIDCLLENDILREQVSKTAKKSLKDFSWKTQTKKVWMIFNS